MENLIKQLVIIFLIMVSISLISCNNGNPSTDSNKVEEEYILSGDELVQIAKETDREIKSSQDKNYAESCARMEKGTLYIYQFIDNDNHEYILKLNGIDSTVKLYDIKTKETYYGTYRVDYNLLLVHFPYENNLQIAFPGGRKKISTLCHIGDELYLDRANAHAKNPNMSLPCKKIKSFYKNECN